MGDVTIRDVPDDVLAVIDRHARSLGLSRSQYLRQLLSQAAATPVTAADLQRLSAVTRDLDDPEVMRGAWPTQP